MAGGPSEQVLQLRSGSTPAASRDAFDEWLCGSCGYRWPHVRVAVEGSSDDDVEVPDLDRGATSSSLPGDLVEQLDAPDRPIPAAVASPHVASALRDAREARGLTISDAARVTRIGERYLRALEDDASLEEFPAPAYAQFFLRNYAEFLELEPQRMAREFDEGHPIHPEPVFQPMTDREPRRRALTRVLVATSILSLVALGVTRFEAGGGSDPVPLSTPATGDVTMGRSDVTRPPPPPPLHGVRAVLRLNDRSWVEAVADGEVLESGKTFEAGQRVVYRADRLLELLLGNAGAVELVVDGERIATGGPGDVVRLRLRLRDGEVVAKTA